MRKNELDRVPWGWAVAVMLATCIPYLVVWFPTPLQHFFPLVLFNSDDHGVYFAWMRQAEDGKLLFRNLFTNEPQRGIYLHAYFLALGQLARLPGIDIPLAYHLGRLLFGVVTLVLVHRLAALFTEDRFERGCIFWTTALSGGLGWLFWRDREIQGAPVDVWQPEALTFPSLYMNGLFSVSFALMLGFVICLLLAETRGVRWAVGAGLCGLVLGNIHSYDVIHLALVWCAYLAAKGIVLRRFPTREFGLACVAGLLTLPSVAHMAWFYQTEPVFKARADTATWSPHPLKYVLGYGLLIPLAVWGARLLARRGTGPEQGSEEWDTRRLLPLAWAIAGITAAYLPFAFQRKMIMGYHFPLALLAGLALAELARRAAPKLRLSAARGPVLVAGLCVAVLAVSNVRYLVRDVHLAFTEGVTSTGIHPVYWQEGLIRAFRWMGKNTGEDAVLLTFPLNGVMAPAFSGRTVYAGHWGETPAFEEKVREGRAFYGGRWNSAERLLFLRDRGITHVLVGRMERQIAEMSRRGTPLSHEPFLRPVFREGETVLFEVIDPTEAAAPGSPAAP